MKKQDYKEPSDNSEKKKDDSNSSSEIKRMKRLIVLLMAICGIGIITEMNLTKKNMYKKRIIQTLSQEVVYQKKVLDYITTQEIMDSELEKSLETSYKIDIVGDDTPPNLLKLKKNLEEICHYFPNTKKVIEKNLDYLVILEFFPDNVGGRYENKNTIVVTPKIVNLVHELFHLCHFNMPEDEYKQLEKDWKKVAGDFYNREYYSVLPTDGLIRPKLISEDILELASYFKVPLEDLPYVTEDIAYNLTDIFLLLKELDKNPNLSKPEKIDEKTLSDIANEKISNYLFIDPSDQRYLQKVELLKTYGFIDENVFRRVEQFIKRLESINNKMLNSKTINYK